MDGAIWNRLRRGPLFITSSQADVHTVYGWREWAAMTISQFPYTTPPDQPPIINYVDAAEKCLFYLSSPQTFSIQNYAEQNIFSFSGLPLSIICDMIFCAMSVFCEAGQ